MFHPQSFLATKELTDRIFQETFGDEKPSPVKDLIAFSFDLFCGRNPGFQACDTAFHDFDHTMQAAAAVADLLIAHNPNPLIPPLARRAWNSPLAVIFFMDTVSLNLRNDPAGSAEKYPAIPFGATCFFAWNRLPALASVA